MEPSTSDPVPSSDPGPPTVVTRRGNSDADRLIPDPDRMSEPTSANQSSAEQQQQRSAGTSSTMGSFDCNICLDTAHDAVVSMCGHLFCWPCLHQWLETSRAHSVCPVCKAAISINKVVPLYGRGSDHTRDPRSKLPPRPAGHRVEPEPNGAAGNGNPGLAGVLGGLFGNMDVGGGNNFRMSVGIGAFPLGFLATTFNLGGGGNVDGEARAGRPNDLPGTATVSLNADNNFVSKLCLFVAFLCVLWLILA